MPAIAHELPHHAPDITDWFGGGPDERLRLGNTNSITTERTVDAHEHLYLEGQRQTHVYLLLEGVVGRYKLLPDGRRQIVSFSYPGDMIGLDCPERHVDSAEALERVRVRTIPFNAIDRLMTTEPGFGQALLRVAAAELADSREQMITLGRKSASEKLAGFLVRIANRNASIGEDPDTITLPMKRSEIADFLGLTIETVSRQFTRLRTARIIHLSSSTHVQVLDADRLQAIADGDDA